MTKAAGKNKNNQKKEIMKTLNKISRVALVTEILALLPLAALAGAYYPVSGTAWWQTAAATGPTNQIVLFTNGVGLWPSSIYAGQSITNVTPFQVANGKDVAIQMNNQLVTANGSTPTNVVYLIGRSVQSPSTMPAGGVTNAAGTGLNIEWFTTLTNTAPASLAANTTFTSHALFGPVLGYSSGLGDGAVNWFYLGVVTAPTTIAVTNSSVWINNF